MMDDPHAFELDARLEQDTVLIADWHLCQVLLMNDQRYPWVILVPKAPSLMTRRETLITLIEYSMRGGNSDEMLQ